MSTSLKLIALMNGPSCTSLTKSAMFSTTFSELFVIKVIVRRKAFMAIRISYCSKIISVEVGPVSIALSVSVKASLALWHYW